MSASRDTSHRSHWGLRIPIKWSVEGVPTGKDAGLERSDSGRFHGLPLSIRVAEYGLAGERKRGDGNRRSGVETNMQIRKGSRGARRFGDLPKGLLTATGTWSFLSICPSPIPQSLLKPCHLYDDDVQIKNPCRMAQVHTDEHGSRDGLITRGAMFLDDPRGKAQGGGEAGVFLKLFDGRARIDRK